MQYQMAGEELQLIRGRLPHFFRSFSLQEEAQMLQTCFTIMQYPMLLARVSSAATPAVPRASRATTAAAHAPHWWEGVGGSGWSKCVGVGTYRGVPVYLGGARRPHPPLLPPHLQHHVTDVGPPHHLLEGLRCGNK